jgi:hypothetical protein
LRTFGGDFNAKLGKKIEQEKILAATDMVYETIMDGNWLCSWKTIYFVLPIHSSSILPSMWLHGGALTKKTVLLSNRLHPYQQASFETFGK